VTGVPGMGGGGGGLPAPSRCGTDGRDRATRGSVLSSGLVRVGVLDVVYVQPCGGWQG